MSIENLNTVLTGMAEREVAERLHQFAQGIKANVDGLVRALGDPPNGYDSWVSYVERHLAEVLRSDKDVVNELVPRMLARQVEMLLTCETFRELDARRKKVTP